ncbi:MAG: ACT domain-containing protein [Fibrobacteraceae bacterium]|jgi:hypothetical protein|nr:MAG: hypothetical protein AUK31_03560 [Fibrobacteres bacterium CG2_30_45_31]
MKIPQISIFVANRPGRLQTICKSLADANINLLSLTLADSGEFGLVRLIVSHPEKAVTVLESSGLAAAITDVIACEVDAGLGGLAKLLATPAGQLQIDYMYAYPMQHEKNYAIMIFRFKDPDAAIDALRKAGAKVLSRKDLLGD